MWEYYYPVNLDSQVASFDSTKPSENWVLMAYMALKEESKITQHAKAHMRNEKVFSLPGFAIKALKAAIEENEETPLVDAQANAQYLAEIYTLLGIAYEQSENYEKAYKYYTKAKDLGKFHRARLLITGQGTVSNLGLAKDLIRERAAMGDLDAQYAQALILSTYRFLGTYIPIPEPTDVEATFIKIAETNNKVAFTLAEIYLDRQDPNIGKVSFMIKGEPLSEERQQKAKELLEKVAKSNTLYSIKAKFYLYQFFPNEYRDLKESVLAWLKEISNTSSHPFSTQAQFHYSYLSNRDTAVESAPNDYLIDISSIFNVAISTYKLKDYTQKYPENDTVKAKSNLPSLISKFHISDLIIISDILRESIERENVIDNILRIIKDKLNTGSSSTYGDWFQNHASSKKFFNYCYIALMITDHLLKDKNKKFIDKTIANDLRILSAISSISLYIYLGYYDNKKIHKYLTDAAHVLLPIITDPNSEHLGLAAYLISLLKSYPACKELLQDLPNDAKFYMEMSRAAGFDQAIIALKPFPLITAFKVISGAAAETATQIAEAASSAANQVAQVFASVTVRAPTPKLDLDLGDVELVEVEMAPPESVVNGLLEEPKVYEDADTDTNWPEKAPMPETSAPAIKPE